ncbi:MAG: purQ, partial [Acidobacteria bacterium]|nr:purQ [Acidobacteriota bacterium]
RRFAGAGGPVLGICNGFQVLLEADMLPGAMLRNRSLKYQCEHVWVKVEQTDTPFTSGCEAGQVLRIPIGHGEGNYYAAPDVIERLEANRQVIFRYATATGGVTPDANPNGSVNNIAGLCSKTRNVVGLMPHPERACELAVGSADGLVLLESVVKSVSRGAFLTAGAVRESGPPSQHSPVGSQSDPTSAKVVATSR